MPPPLLSHQMFPPGVRWISLVCILNLSGVQSAYSGDIVQYWNLQVSLAVNASALASAQIGWVEAYVHTAILLAADESKYHNRDVQQTAVSFAAHDTLVSVFLEGYPNFDASMIWAEDAIGARNGDAELGRKTGEQAANMVMIARTGDGHTKFMRYTYQPPSPGVYQATPPDFPFEPLAPNAPFIRPFGGIDKVKPWTPPPDSRQEGYEEFLNKVKEKGAREGSTRTEFETETAYLCLESMASWFNRFASLIIGDKFKDDVLESAKFYTMLNYGVANGGFMAYKTKYTYNTWRPITALHFNGTYLASGNKIYDQEWTPLIVTPTHQDYVSGHASYAGAAGGILKRYLKTDTLDPPVTISSNVTTDSIGVLTRTYHSINDAVRDCANSRVFAGLHFQFAVDEGTKAGDAEAEKVFNNFAKGWKLL